MDTPRSAPDLSASPLVERAVALGSTLFTLASAAELDTMMDALGRHKVTAWAQVAGSVLDGPAPHLAREARQWASDCEAAGGLRFPGMSEALRAAAIEGSLHGPRLLACIVGSFLGHLGGVPAARLASIPAVGPFLREMLGEDPMPAEFLDWIERVVEWAEVELLSGADCLRLAGYMGPWEAPTPSKDDPHEG